MRLSWLLVLGFAIALLAEGCSRPGDDKARANAAVFSKEIEDIIGIDIIAAPKLGGKIFPLSLPEGAKDAVVIGSMDTGKEESDIFEATSELNRMLKRPSDKALCLVTRIWLHIRLKDRDYARYCMYDPNGTYFLFTYKGPVDMKSWKDKNEWINEGISVKSSKKFRDVINRHIPEDRKLPYM